VTQKIVNDQIDQVGSDALNDTDIAILGEVDSSLANGLQLKTWWS